MTALMNDPTITPAFRSNAGRNDKGADEIPGNAYISGVRTGDGEKTVRFVGAPSNGLLKGKLYLDENGKQTPMNFRRATSTHAAQYHLPGSEMVFPCSMIDAQIAEALQWVILRTPDSTLIEAHYAHEVHSAFGYDLRHALPEEPCNRDDIVAEVNWLSRHLCAGSITHTEWVERGGRLWDNRDQCMFDDEIVDVPGVSPFLPDFDYARHVVENLGMYFSILSEESKRVVLSLTVKRVLVNPSGGLLICPRRPFANYAHW